MSVDFMSIVSVVSPARARAVVACVEGAESLGEIVDESGSTIHDFARQGETVSLVACKKEMRGRAPAPEDLVAAYLEGIPSVEFPGAVFVMSSNFPLLSVIDRVVAIPNGVSFLRGRAYRRFRPNARERAEQAWRGLLERVGGERALARRVAPYVDRGGDALDDAMELTRAIGRGFERARQKDRDLLMIGCLASEMLEGGGA